MNKYLESLKNKIDNLEQDELEYYERNLNYEGLSFSNLELIVGRNSAKFLNEQFKSNKEISTIKVDKILGETEKLYHFSFNNHQFFTYKEDTENPFDKVIESVPFDEEKYNNNNTQNRILKSFQPKGIKFMKMSNPAFCWDDMGTGKTTMSILAALDSGYKKILVVTLAGLKINWKREIAIYHADSKIISGSEWNDEDKQFTIINYDILKNFVAIPKGKGKPAKGTNNQLVLENYDCIILDEVHRAKNPTTGISTCIKKICSSGVKKKVIALSGTPIEKNVDFYNICRSLNVHIGNLITNSSWYLDNIENYNNYALRYCNAFEQVIDSKKAKTDKEIIAVQLPEECKKHRNYKYLLSIIQQHGKCIRGEWSFIFETGNKKLSNFNLNDLDSIKKMNLLDKRKKVMVLGRYVDGKKIENTNSIELNQRIKHLQIRRTKKEVLKDFPDKFIIPLYFDLTMNERAKYIELWDEYLATKNKGTYTPDEMQTMAESIKIRQFLAILKVPHSINFIENKIDLGYKIAIFTHFKEEYKSFLDGLGKISIGVDSTMSVEKRQAKVDEFQNNENIKVIVGNIKTLGTGWNITKADISLINSPNWNSGEHEQAEDRSYRIGREDDTTTYYALFEGTHEEEVYERANSKATNKQTFLGT